MSGWTITHQDLPDGTTRAVRIYDPGKDEDGFADTPQNAQERPLEPRECNGGDCAIINADEPPCPDCPYYGEDGEDGEIYDEEQEGECL